MKAPDYWKSHYVTAVEHRLVVDGYLRDPDFDRWYPLSAVMSLLSSPPPGPLEQLATPAMFLVARRGPAPAYIADLYRRLPAIRTQMVDIDGGVYWMLSHPQTATKIVCAWFDSSLTPPGSPSPA